MSSLGGELPAVIREVFGLEARPELLAAFARGYAEGQADYLLARVHRYAFEEPPEDLAAIAKALARRGIGLRELPGRPMTVVLDERQDAARIR